MPKEKVAECRVTGPDGLVAGQRNVFGLSSNGRVEKDREEAVSVRLCADENLGWHVTGIRSLETLLGGR